MFCQHYRKFAQCSRAILSQKKEAENTLLIIQAFSLPKKNFFLLWFWGLFCLSAEAKGWKSFHCSFVGGYSAIDLKKPPSLLSFMICVRKGWREIVQLFFPIHDKSKVDTTVCVYYLLSSTIYLWGGLSSSLNTCYSALRHKSLD